MNFVKNQIKKLRNLSAQHGYTCLRSVDQVCKEIFVRKFELEGKATGLSLLPPCAVNPNLIRREETTLQGLINKQIT